MTYRLGQGGKSISKRGHSFNDGLKGSDLRYAIGGGGIPVERRAGVRRRRALNGWRRVWRSRRGFGILWNGGFGNVLGWFRPHIIKCKIRHCRATRSGESDIMFGGVSA